VPKPVDMRYCCGKNEPNSKTMSDNVIKFRKPKPPRKAPNPMLRKLMIIAIVIIVFAAAWAYFQVTGAPAP
jgi:hypothetical protein